MKKIFSIIIVLAIAVNLTAIATSAYYYIDDWGSSKQQKIAFDKTYTATATEDSEVYYKFFVSQDQKVRITIGNYSKLINAYCIFRFFEMDDVKNTLYFSSGPTTLINGSYLDTYNVSEYDNESAYTFNLAHDIKIAADGTGYIDKFLPIGYYYLGIETYGLEDIDYSVKVSDTPISDLTASAKKAMKKAKVKKLKVKNKTYNKITATWKKINNAKGYQVQISKKKNFKKLVSSKFTSQSWLSIEKKKQITFKNLKKGTTYYIRVRAYTTYKDIYDNAKKVYGSWSKKIKANTKK